MDWLVDLHDDLLGPREPAPDVGDVRREALGERLRHLASSAVVGHQLVAAGSFDLGGQRERARDLHLERARVLGEQLLGGVEVLRQQGARAPQVAARSDTETPSGGLQVGIQTLEHGQAAADHAGMRAAGRQLGHEDEVADLAADDAQRLGDVVAGHRPDARACSHTLTRRVSAIVAEPTTRVPS